MRAALLDVSRHQDRCISGKQVADNGYIALVARCSIGRQMDPDYHYWQDEAKKANLLFGAYGVLWPANKSAARDATFLTSNMGTVDFVIGDVELGVRPDNYGHSAISGADLVAQTREYLRTIRDTSPLPTIAYIPDWYWDDPKMPTPAGWENEYWLWPSYYPYDNGTVPQQLDPGCSLPDKYIAPGWRRDRVIGWQWTARKHLVGAGVRDFDSNLLFGDAKWFCDTLGITRTPSLEERVKKMEDFLRTIGYHPPEY